MRKQLTRKDLIFIGIVALMHVCYFVMACSFKRIYTGDSFEYVYEALNIKGHGLFYSGSPAMPILPEYMTQRQPGYPLFLMLPYMLGIGNWGVIVLQNILSIYIIFYCRKVFISLGHQLHYDWLLLTLLLACPSQFINANTIAPDVLLQACVVAYVGCFVRLWQRKQLKSLLWMSLWLITGLMVKPVLYPFVLVHIIVCIVTMATLKLKRNWPAVVALALMPLGAVVAYNSWNYERTGKFHFTSNQSFNAIYYYYKYLDAHEGGKQASAFLSAERDSISKISSYPDRYNYANARGMQLLKENLGPYLWFHFKNSGRILIEPGKAEMDLFTGKLTYGQLYAPSTEGFYATIKEKGVAGLAGYTRQNPSLLVALLVALVNVVRLLGLGMFLMNKNIHPIVRLFIGGLIAYFALLSGPIANTRYFLPVALVAIGAACIGWVSKLKTKEQHP